MRIEALSCIRERLLNRKSDGRVFATESDRKAWLFGQGERRGFFSDPVAAIEENVVCSASRRVLHRGISLDDREKSELRQKLESFLLGGLTPMPALAGMPSMNQPAHCDPATDPNCWY